MEAPVLPYSLKSRWVKNCKMMRKGSCQWFYSASDSTLALSKGARPNFIRQARWSRSIGHYRVFFLFANISEAIAGREGFSFHVIDIFRRQTNGSYVGAPFHFGMQYQNGYVIADVWTWLEEPIKMQDTLLWKNLQDIGCTVTIKS